MVVALFDCILCPAMANAEPNLNASQFYVTTRANIDFLDEKHTVFGKVVEGSSLSCS